MAGARAVVLLELMSYRTRRVPCEPDPLFSILIRPKTRSAQRMDIRDGTSESIHYTEQEVGVIRQVMATLENDTSVRFSSIFQGVFSHDGRNLAESRLYIAMRYQF